MLGTRLAGRYNIIKSLGEGGFGEAYLAEDQHLPGAQHCVVKKLKTEHHDTSTLQVARRLFDSEAKILHKLGSHDQIPRLLAHFEENEGFYLVEEFIAGHNLDQELVMDQPLDEADVITLLRDILEVLAFVHQNQVIHRDIKPSNLIRRQEDQRIVLIDFGAVKQVTTQILNNHSRTPQTVLIGSPGYVPSEQFRGQPKLSSDIYAVGMIGIQALTGINPAMGQLPEDEETGELVWRDQAQVSPAFATILEKMVLYDYRQRYSTASSALAAIQTLMIERETAAANPQPSKDEVAWAETDVSAANTDVGAAMVNTIPPVQTELPAELVAPTAVQATPPKTMPQDSTRFQSTANVPAAPVQAAVTGVPGGAGVQNLALPEKARGFRKGKAVALGITVILLGGGGIGFASPHMEPLCQIFNNCSRNIRFQTVYEDASAEAKSAQEEATEAQNVEELQAAHDRFETAIMDLESVPDSVQVHATVQKELPDYDTQFKAVQTRLAAEKKAQEQFEKAEASATAAEEKMEAVKKSETIATLEDAKKQWQASQNHLQNIPKGSLMESQVKAKRQRNEDMIQTLQGKIDTRVAAERRRQQAAAAARRRQQAAAASRTSTASKTTSQQPATASRSRSTSSAPRRSTPSAPRRSTSSPPRQTAPKAAPKEPLWGPPAGKEPLW